MRIPSQKRQNTVKSAPKTENKLIGPHRRVAPHNVGLVILYYEFGTANIRLFRWHKIRNLNILPFHQMVNAAGFAVGSNNYLGFETTIKACSALKNKSIPSVSWVETSKISEIKVQILEDNIVEQLFLILCCKKSKFIEKGWPRVYLELFAGRLPLNLKGTVVHFIFREIGYGKTFSCCFPRFRKTKQPRMLTVYCIVKLETSSSL